MKAVTRKLPFLCTNSFYADTSTQTDRPATLDVQETDRTRRVSRSTYRSGCLHCAHACMPRQVPKLAAWAGLFEKELFHVVPWEGQRESGEPLAILVITLIACMRSFIRGVLRRNAVSQTLTHVFRQNTRLPIRST